MKEIAWKKFEWNKKFEWVLSIVPMAGAFYFEDVLWKVRKKY